MRILPMGDRAVLVEDPPGDPAGWSESLVRMALAGIIDVVPAERTVLVRCTDEHALAHVASRLGDVAATRDTAAAAVAPLTIPVRYDGLDLESVAELTGRTTDDVVELHTAVEYRVAFCGFAPGFAYLRGLPAELHLPRRPTPRLRVPAGAVAIAAHYAAVYPLESPGGWHLLGRTELSMWDEARDPPALLSPGMPIRFEAR